MRSPLTPAIRKLLPMLALVPVIALFVFVGFRSGPLAPIGVTVAAVENAALTPALFGVGTVEARYTYRIGPTAAGRLKSVLVQVQDHVQAGQLLGEMEPVELDARVQAQNATLGRSQATVRSARAQLDAASARQVFAVAQERRHDQLLLASSISLEAADATRQERRANDATLLAARAGLEAAEQDLERVRADREAAIRQRANLRLLAPVAGLVASRDADPGTTLVSGQSVIELIDPRSLWIHVRFDQRRTSGLRPGQRAQVVLRSRAGEVLAGTVSRVEPRADAVTEELLAKVTLDVLPDPLPPLGELAEITVVLPTAPAGPVVPNASLQRLGGRLGVWVLRGHEPHFTPVRLGASDLEGRVLVLEGLAAGDRVVVYSQRALTTKSRIRIVDHLARAPS